MFRAIVIKVAQTNNEGFTIVNNFSQLIMILFDDTIATAWL